MARENPYIGETVYIGLPILVFLYETIGAGFGVLAWN